MVSGVALYVVLPRLARVFASWPDLTELRPAWFAGSIVAETGSFVCTFGIQRLTLGTRSWFAVVTAGLTGNTVTDVLPGGDAAGAAVQFSMLSSAGIDGARVGAGLSAASLLQIGGLLALPVLSLPAILGGAHVSRGLVETALLGLVSFALFAVGSIILLTTDRPLAVIARAAEWLWNHRPGRHRSTTDLAAVVLQQRNAVRSVLGRHSIQAVLLVVGRIGLDYSSLLCALRATGARPSPSLVLLAYAATNVIALVPLTPGGLGVVEGSLSGLLVLAGAPSSDAVVATLAYRVASYWLPICAGVVAYFFFRRRFGPVSVGAHGGDTQREEATRSHQSEKGKRSLE
ncbi:MAG TPA: lysylphosphatidylglycerol synthase transmembrane domain-containing protein [Acidimicrobiales bacterium]|nr:lysylphosphatidylglycerol synthase transmembrane domain-containing protein [Acidimicrobiales bacterium]